MDEVIIKTTQTIKGLFSVALPPGEYEAGYNKNGAVFIKLPHGQTLGVKPGEFEFAKAPEHLLDRWRTSVEKEHEIIGKRILDALDTRKMTQRELANKTGITEATISRYAPRSWKATSVLSSGSRKITGSPDSTPYISARALPDTERTPRVTRGSYGSPAAVTRQ